MRHLYRLIAMCFALMTVPIALAQATNIQPRLLAESSRPAPGKTVTIAVDMKTAPGWHGYWSNPGEAGLPPRLTWSLPPGATISAPRFPVPQLLSVAGIANYVFKGDHALLFDLALPAGLPAGAALPIRLDAEWLACSDTVCVPERGRIALDLASGDGTRDGQALFDRFRAALPRPLGAETRFARTGDSLRLAIPFPADAEIGSPRFFPAASGLIRDSASQRFSRQGDVLVATIPAPAGNVPVAGVLALGNGQGFALSAVPGAVPEDGTPIDAPAKGIASAVLLAIGGAILGGVILNIMPCVFPIVSLKALSLARAGGNERAAKREALAYASGVIATCLALGAIVLGARAAGASLGWAFQLQNPWIVFALLLIATLITLNLAGIFEVRGFGGGQALVERGGTQGAFWTGVLAAFVATPCTGPFMAAALGAALILPLPAALAVFAGLGLGIALPFLAIGFVPALRRLLPRPGAWMARFQRILSVPMALTVVALLWLVDRSQGPQAFQTALIAVLLVTIGAIVAGRRPTRATGAALAVVLVVGVTAIKVPNLFGTSAPQQPVAAFSEPALAAARAANRPVFLYFTADWCITCKANERGAIATDRVQRAFAAKGVTMMVGDWTDGDPAITRFLNAHGAFGVPLYLYYAPGAAEPAILPQVLTPALLSALPPA